MPKRLGSQKAIWNGCRIAQAVSNIEGSVWVRSRKELRSAGAKDTEQRGTMCGRNVWSLIFILSCSRSDNRINARLSCEALRLRQSWNSNCQSRRKRGKGLDNYIPEIWKNKGKPFLQWRFMTLILYSLTHKTWPNNITSRDFFFENHCQWGGI